ncbi:MAG TPA: hypothetical protein IAB01_01690 [Candidatus Avidesulfovibrio excrementigallinarum]|nr:hypothetical protein [Candidatus Avidesulfovibrio excrementigallinarum]
MQSDESVVQSGSPRRERGLWVSYIMLLIFAFSAYWPLLLILGIITLPFCYMSRSGYQRQGRPVETAHAAWQVNTVWIAFLLIVVAFMVLLGVSAWMQGDPEIQAKINAITQSGMSAPEKLAKVWAIPSARVIVGVFVTFMLCCLIWPLKRTLHGIMALWADVRPSELGARQWLAFGLAVLLQAAVMLIPSLLM